MKKHHFLAFMAGGITLTSALPSHAEITILDKNTQSSALLAPLSVNFGGSIRPEWILTNGAEPNKYYRRGHDGGSRIHFNANYSLSEHTSFIGYYELGFDIPHVLGLKGNYNSDGNRDYQRQLYAGISDDRYGTLTYGHQYGIYYSVVGMKSDVWDNDGHAGATAIGFNGNYDGANRPKNSVLYKNTFGQFTLYANYLLPEDQTADSAGFDYRRNQGGGLGFDYQIAPALTWSTAYSSTQADLKDTTQQKGWQQQVSGTALTWQPGNWYLVGTASYYKDFVPSTKSHTVDGYFAGSGYGLEAFAGYTFKIDKPYLESVQPYVAVDNLRLTGNQDYHANHVYLGAGTTIGHGLTVYVERTIASTTDKEADTTWLNIFYNF